MVDLLLVLVANINICDEKVGSALVVAAPDFDMSLVQLLLGQRRMHSLARQRVWLTLTRRQESTTIVYLH